MDQRDIDLFGSKGYMIPLIDGGTEGFRGQSRVIIPTVTSCFECSLDLLSAKVTYPVCTIANTPRLPEHCIEWATQIEWNDKFPGKNWMETISNILNGYIKRHWKELTSSILVELLNI